MFFFLLIQTLPTLWAERILILIMIFFYNLLGFEIYRRRWTNSHIPTQALSQHTFLHGTAAALLCQNGMPGFQEILDIGFPCASVCVGAYIDIILVQFV